MKKGRKPSKNISFVPEQFDFIKRKANVDERSFSYIISKLIKKAMTEENIGNKDNMAQH